MKKIIIMILGMFFFAAPAYAQNLSREDLAQMVFPIIANCDWESAASNAESGMELCAAISCGLIEDSDEKTFYTDENVTDFEFIKCMATAWEIRFGGLDGASLGASLTGYSDLSEYEKKILDKAVMLGIVKNSMNFSKGALISYDDAEMFSQKIIDDIEIMRSYGMGDEAASFMENGKIVASAKNGKLYFYKTYNRPPDFDCASLILALYDGTTLVDVSCKNYSGLLENGFSILHTSVSVPATDGEYRVKAFMLDDIQSLHPIYEYRLIR